MHQTDEICPICECADDCECKGYSTGKDSEGFFCERCGQFEITRTARISYFPKGSRKLDRVQSAALSHALASVDGKSLVNSPWMDTFMEAARLANPVMQASRLISLIGDGAIESGDGFAINPFRTPAKVGTLNGTTFQRLIDDVLHAGLIREIGSHQQLMRGQSLNVKVYQLTFAGWQQYESEKSGKTAGRYGFLAMKFGDPELEGFVREVIKPCVKNGINYDLIDIREVARAGVIDNILRQQIRDAAFVLVDLTHDNSGAYWEAGYAEGLGKPVIYLCEQSKFDSAKTHFDTNHCTTVMWKIGEGDLFSSQLVATIRRSLNLFPT